MDRDVAQAAQRMHPEEHELTHERDEGWQPMPEAGLRRPASYQSGGSPRQPGEPRGHLFWRRSVDILITALSAFGAAMVVLALAVLWVASRYDDASSELARPEPPEQPPPAPRKRRRFRRQARARTSTRR